MTAVGTMPAMKQNVGAPRPINDARYQEAAATSIAAKIRTIPAPRGRCAQQTESDRRRRLRRRDSEIIEPLCDSIPAGKA